MKPYAVIETGGKQYIVEQDAILNVELLNLEKDASFDLNPVLAISDGSKLTIGKPSVNGVRVSATVLKHIRAKKVIAYKKKRRKSYSRKKGHRQEQTVLKITGIEQPSAA
jgi:large subunit ribosomal protein L21